MAWIVHIGTQVTRVLFSYFLLTEKFKLFSALGILYVLNPFPWRFPPCTLTNWLKYHITGEVVLTTLLHVVSYSYSPPSCLACSVFACIHGT